MTAKQIDDGGPAFPNVWEDNPSPGMSLRDWWAGLAMQAAIPMIEEPEDIPQYAYAVADAMLTLRRRAE